jgi:xanthine dehydrogenase molybdopterin-binding subunit B
MSASTLQPAPQTPPALALVGQGVVRTDGHAKVTGQALYVDDVRYGATVRSIHAHALIRGITLNLDYDWSDVVVVTSVDIPGENVIALMTDDQPALAEQVVRHVTEPIALVAAPTREKALEAARNVRVEYQPLPALIDMARSQGEEPRIFGRDNVFKKLELRLGDVKAVQGGVLIEGEYNVGHQEQLYIEPQGVLAVPREDGGVTILGSLQCPYYVVKALTRVLGHDKLNVVQAATGGGFGGKEEYPSMLAAHAALLALRAGRPVKMVYRRDEDLRATTKRHPARVKLRTRVDESGRLLSLEADVLMDGGAYNTLSPVVISRAALHVSGPYRWETALVRAAVVATHSPPNGAFRGFGAPQARPHRACSRARPPRRPPHEHVSRRGSHADGSGAQRRRHRHRARTRARTRREAPAPPPRRHPPRRRWPGARASCRAAASPGLARLRLHGQRRGRAQG